MSKEYRLIIILFLLLIDATTLAATNRFRVTDEVLTVYGEPERINELGKLHRGDEFDIVGEDGRMYVFMYKGKKAYAASYCCELIKDESSDKSTAPVESPKKEERTKEAEPEQDMESGETEVPSDAVENTATDDGGRSLRDVAEGMKGLLGLLVALGLVAGIWSLFGTRSFENLFNKLAGRYITDCSKLMYWRPAIAFVIMGLVGKYADSVPLALAAVGIYELALLWFRAKKLGSFRASVAEALYLLASAMGFLLLFWMFIILAFLASGGSSSSSKSSDDDNKGRSGERHDCSDCDFYNGRGKDCGMGYNAYPGNSCGHYRSVMGAR